MLVRYYITELLSNVYNFIRLNMCNCLYLCVQQRNDDEAVVDRGGTRCQQRADLEDEDLEGTWTDMQCIWNTKSLKKRKTAAESAHPTLNTAAFLLTDIS